MGIELKVAMKRYTVTQLDDKLTRFEAFTYADRAISQIESRETWRQGHPVHFENGVSAWVNRIGVTSGVPGYHVKVRGAADEEG